MHRISESLADRASDLTVWPMPRRERSGFGRCGSWEELLGTRDRDWLDLVATQPARHEDRRGVAASDCDRSRENGRGTCDLVRRLPADLP